MIPCERVKRKRVELPKRSKDDEYDDIATLAGRTFVPEAYYNGMSGTK